MIIKRKIERWKQYVKKSLAMIIKRKIVRWKLYVKKISKDLEKEWRSQVMFFEKNNFWGETFWFRKKHFVPLWE